VLEAGDDAALMPTSVASPAASTTNARNFLFMEILSLD
jgi:hypothetical protein